MAVLGGTVPTLSCWITHGSRKPGTCTTRAKKTWRKQLYRRQVKNVADWLSVTGNLLLEAMPWKEKQLGDITLSLRDPL